MNKFFHITSIQFFECSILGFLNSSHRLGRWRCCLRLGIREKQKTKTKASFFSSRFYFFFCFCFSHIVLGLVVLLVFIFSWPFSCCSFHIGVIVGVGVHIGVIPFLHRCCPFHVRSLFFHLGLLALLMSFWCSSHMVLLFFARWWWYSFQIRATIFLALVFPLFLH